MEQRKPLKARFDFGRVVATAVLSNDMQHDQQFNNEVLKCFERHILADWGDLDQEDKEANDEDLKNNCGRLLSRYHTSKDDIYILTEWQPTTQTQSDLYTILMYCNEY